MNTIQQLKRESTFKLLFLNAFTFGIYGSYYLKGQTEILNNQFTDHKKMDVTLMGGIIALAWVSGIIDFIATITESVTGELSSGLDGLNTLVGLGYSISMLIWAFKFRSMFHEQLGINDSSDSRWLNGFFTFIFGILYINYRINVLNDDQKLA